MDEVHFGIRLDHRVRPGSHLPKVKSISGGVLARLARPCEAGLSGAKKARSLTEDYPQIVPPQLCHGPQKCAKPAHMAQFRPIL